MKYLAVRNVVPSRTENANYMNEVVYALHCHLCGAEDEGRKYVWKYKEKWVPFYLCYHCYRIVCEECVDRHHKEAQRSRIVGAGQVYVI